MGKPIGNGHPLGAVVTTRAIADAFANGMEYFNTFGGNPVSAAIGLAVLDVIEEEGLREHARVTGERLIAGLRELAGAHEAIGDVRGLGLFVGIELVRDRETREPDAGRSPASSANRAAERGVLLSTDGPFHNVMKIKPPLVFSAADADRLVETVDAVLARGRAGLIAAVASAPRIRSPRNRCATPDGPPCGIVPPARPRWALGARTHQPSRGSRRHLFMATLRAAQPRPGHPVFATSSRPRTGSASSPSPPSSPRACSSPSPSPSRRPPRPPPRRATLPSGLRRRDARHRAEQPDGHRLRPGRTRLRRREARDRQDVADRRRLQPERRADDDARHPDRRMNYWDRGLLGLAVDPNWPASPYIYVLYTYDAIPGGVRAALDDGDPNSDPCASPPGGTTDGCVVQNRLERITVNTTSGISTAPDPLLTGWCQQFPSHSAGTVDVRPRRDALRQRRRGRQLQPRRPGLRPAGRHAVRHADPVTPRTRAATRRAARAGPMTAADGRGRRPPRPELPPRRERVRRPERRRAPAEPGDRRGRGRQPGDRRHSTRSASGSSPTGSATRSG